MTKNIILGALVAVLVGALAVASLDLWSGSASADVGQQHGRSDPASGRDAGSAQTESDEPQGNGYGRQMAEDAATGTSEPAGSDKGSGRGAAGQRGGGQSTSADMPAGDPRRGEPQPEPQVTLEEWIEYEGTMVALDDEGLIISTHDGQEMSIKLGPSWYWQQQDTFSAEIGDSLSVVGFYDGDYFEAGSVTNETSGQVLTLRTEGGQPLWSGRGRRGQQ